GIAAGDILLLLCPFVTDSADLALKQGRPSAMIMLASAFFRWFTGGDTQYHTLFQCMNHDRLWIAITVASGYSLIALHWWKNQKLLPDSQAKRALGTMRNIFVFCGICGYLFIPIKMFWPAWRLYDIVIVFLVYYTWRYAWNSSNLKVVYGELGRTQKLSDDL